MNEKRKKYISKFLSLVLRHKPEIINLNLDKNGWGNVNDLLLNKKLSFTYEELIEVVNTNDKQRFSFNDDKSRIRANQGHSINELDLELEKTSPPEYLFHGTVLKFIPAIREKGLLKMNRQHVHLSKDIATATKVGIRRGKPIILQIRAKELEENGHIFYLSKNKVWLTDNVPPEYINFKNL